jgi:hypothetical protein
VPSPPSSISPARRRLLIGLGLPLLAALLIRIAWTQQILSDGSNTILEGSDFAHGNVLLHGWILSDVSFYALEVPVAALSVLMLGVSAAAVHLTAGLVFTLVIACTLWCERGSDARGTATRWVLVLAVLLVPLADSTALHTLIFGVDHLGSSVFILLSALIVDRLRGRWYAPWLLMPVLTLGEVSDGFVTYVGVPAVVGVCFWRILADRRLSWDHWDLLRLAAAAVVSVPLARHMREAMRHLGAYAMTAPDTVMSPRSEWPEHLRSAWYGLRVLLGFARPGAGIEGACTFALGWVLLGLIVLGAIRTLWHWRTSHTAQRISVLLVPGALAAYTLSEQSAKAGNAFDLAGAVPFCALLAANAFPDRWGVGRRGLRKAAVGAIGAVTAFAVLFAAAQPSAGASSAGLAARLRELQLSYGIGDYQLASSTTVQSGQQVTVRAVVGDGTGFEVYAWETRTPWYSAAKHDARFFVAGTSGSGTTPAEVVRAFGRPEAEYPVGHYVVLVYSYNLLTRIRVATRPTG